MRAEVCLGDSGGWRALVLRGVCLWGGLVGAGLAQAQSAPGTLVPTLGQLADAQARKARDEWMKSKATESAEPVPQVASPSAAAVATTAIAAPPSPLPKREPVYAVEGIYGPAGDLRAELSMNGTTQTVRAGERLGDGWLVQAIAPDAVTMVRDPQADLAQARVPHHKRKK